MASHVRVTHVSLYAHVHLHLEYLHSLNYKGKEQQTGKKGEIPWVWKSPGFSFHYQEHT